MYEIEVADRQHCIRVGAGWIEDVVRQTLLAEQVTDAEIAVALLDDAAIHQVNREHLEHDYPTDVISFLYEATPSGHPAPSTSTPRGTGLSLEGEILISTETAVRMAGEVGCLPEAEVTLYLVHGLLHLCGYDDLQEAERRVMRVREREILKLWNLVPHEHI